MIKAPIHIVNGVYLAIHHNWVCINEFLSFLNFQQMALRFSTARSDDDYQLQSQFHMFMKICNLKTR